MGRKGKRGSRPISQGGMAVAISAGPQVDAPPACTEEFAVVSKSGAEVEYACGHTFAASFAHNFYGDIRTLTDKMLTQRERCGECLLAMVKKVSIRCVLCGHIIFPSEAVALYDYDISYK